MVVERKSKTERRQEKLEVAAEAVIRLVNDSYNCLVPKAELQRVAALPDKWWNELLGTIWVQFRYPLEFVRGVGGGWYRGMPGTAGQAAWVLYGAPAKGHLQRMADVGITPEGGAVTLAELTAHSSQADQEMADMREQFLLTDGEES